MSVRPELVLAEAEAVPRDRRLLGRLRTLGLFDRCALVVFAVVFTVSMIGPWIAPHNPILPVGVPFSHPGGEFRLGTDDIGQDILSRILYGARQSWTGALAVIASGVLIGTAVGLVAGARGGIVDAVLMRTTDIFLALPAPILALAVAAALGRSYAHTLIAVAIVWWPLYARIVRGEVFALSHRPHMEAARLAGIPAYRLWTRHLLPGAFAPILIAASLDVGGLILTVAGLSFLGLGSPQPAPELGSMTAAGIPYLLNAPWIALFPALAIFLIALASNLAGDALRALLED
jgi:ABC-type dipeptide/oligopeptide/nickel transport system permease subunit